MVSEQRAECTSAEARYRSTLKSDTPQDPVCKRQSRLWNFIISFHYGCLRIGSRHCHWSSGYTMLLKFSSRLIFNGGVYAQQSGCCPIVTCISLAILIRLILPSFKYAPACTPCQSMMWNNNSERDLLPSITRCCQYRTHFLRALPPTSSPFHSHFTANQTWC